MRDGIGSRTRSNETRGLGDMDAPTGAAPGSATPAELDVIATDVLIVGFGLSAIPLIRELERDGIDYAVISDGESIWDRLERHGRLDFDLVSSMHTSLYSFELVHRDTADRYLTSKDYLAFIRHYQSRYAAKVVKDWVTSIDNHPSHSTVRTRSGRLFHARHLVISTAFKRKMNQQLADFDYASLHDKTIAITGMGDSFNLMVSKLIPNNNKIILITNGFMMLDKLIFHGGISYTLDQLEYHNIRHVSRLLYRKTIMTGFEFVWLCQKFLKFLSLRHVYYKYPLAIPRLVVKRYMNYFGRNPVPNGLIIIKYWPIDSYQTLFDNQHLTQSIRDGYLLNDLAFFLEEGLVQLWPKQETTIDRENRIVRWKDEVVSCHCILDADHEAPNLPEIVANREGHGHGAYEYDHRHNFMGIVPKQLHNVFFIGFTRPTTGGLNNITEMQCLFTHKMIADPEFNRAVYANIEERISHYNKSYYPHERTHSDHLVHYGFYTDDIARLMGIGSRLSKCRSPRDLAVHFIFPNNAFKYRQNGRYKVDGVREMIDRIYDGHNGFASVIHYLLHYALVQLTSYIAVIMVCFQYDLPVLLLPVLLIAVLLNPVPSFVAASTIPHNRYVNLMLIAGLGLTAYCQNAVVPIVTLVASFAMTYVLRRLGWTRRPFNDLSNKRDSFYRDFFRRYCAAFRDVFGKSQSAGHKRAP
jgi:hypothetical protein